MLQYLTAMSSFSYISLLNIGSAASEFECLPLSECAFILDGNVVTVHCTRTYNDTHIVIIIPCVIIFENGGGGELWTFWPIIAETGPGTFQAILLSHTSVVYL